jgi:hypothetical protein
VLQIGFGMWKIFKFIKLKMSHYPKKYLLDK